MQLSEILHEARAKYANEIDQIRNALKKVKDVKFKNAKEEDGKLFIYLDDKNTDPNEIDHLNYAEGLIRQLDFVDEAVLISPSPPKGKREGAFTKTFWRVAVTLKDEAMNEDLNNPQKVYVGKNMDNEKAKNKAKKYATRDFRGVKYNKDTGYVTLT